jgi:hypothetical protein
VSMSSIQQRVFLFGSFATNSNVHGHGDNLFDFVEGHDDVEKCIRLALNHCLKHNEQEVWIIGVTKYQVETAFRRMFVENEQAVDHQIEEALGRIRFKYARLLEDQNSHYETRHWEWMEKICAQTHITPKNNVGLIIAYLSLNLKCVPIEVLVRIIEMAHHYKSSFVFFGDLTIFPKHSREWMKRQGLILQERFLKEDRCKDNDD